MDRQRSLANRVSEEPFVFIYDSMQDAEAVAAAERTTQTSLTFSAFFYHFDRQRVYGDDVLLEENWREGVVLPRAVLFTLFAYLILVIRWNPESRWVLRLLRGRRWRE